MRRAAHLCCLLVVLSSFGCGNGDNNGNNENSTANNANNAENNAENNTSNTPNNTENNASNTPNNANNTGGMETNECDEILGLTPIDPDTAFSMFAGTYSVSNDGDWIQSSANPPAADVARCDFGGDSAPWSDMTAYTLTIEANRTMRLTSDAEEIVFTWDGENGDSTCDTGIGINLSITNANASTFGAVFIDGNFTSATTGDAMTYLCTFQSAPQ